MAWIASAWTWRYGGHQPQGEARETIARALRELDFGKTEKLARINSVGTGLEREDIEAVLPYHPDGIVIPKLESLDQIQWAHEIIEAAELANGWGVNSIRMLVGVETAKGIINLKEFASHPRLDGLIFGSEDFAASMAHALPRLGISACAQRRRHARRGQRASSHRHGLHRFPRHDQPESRSGAGRADGLRRQADHPPGAGGAVQEAFTPDDEEIAYARRIVETFEAAKEGKAPTNWTAR